MRLSILLVSLAAGGFAAPGSRALPEAVYFRSGTETFNSRYYFVIRDGHVWVRPRNHGADAWRPLKLHHDLSRPGYIDADSDILIALDSMNRIFTMFNALEEDEGKFKWTRRWGAPFRLGRGMSVPRDNDGLTLSFLSPGEDGYYRTSNGNKYDVGRGVTNIFFLGKGGTRITYLDPWLPNDFSYEAGGPLDGRFQSVSISASGSTLFLINKYGDMFTRTYDFDMVGADDFFFDYSYHKKEYTVSDTSGVLPRRIPRPLPLPGWTRQPKIRGVITDRITVFKTGKGAWFRTLRVEGLDSLDRTGYFEKDAREPAWRFVETGLGLSGSILENTPEDRSGMALGPDESVRFEGRFEGMRIEVPDFHPYCSPAALKIMFEKGDSLELVLHSHETLRQFKRERGLSDEPLKLQGALEAPDRVRGSTGGAARDFMAAHWEDDAFVEVRIEATSGKLVIKGPGKIQWSLKKE